MNLFKDFILRLVLCVKDIGTMYIVYGAIAGIVGTMFLIVIKMELAYLSIQFFVNYYQYYKVDIVYGLVFFFWVLIIALFIDFVNWLIFLLFNVVDIASCRVHNLNFWSILMQIIFNFYLKFKLYFILNSLVIKKYLPIIIMVYAFFYTFIFYDIIFDTNLIFAEDENPTKSTKSVIIETIITLGILCIVFYFFMSYTNSVNSGSKGIKKPKTQEEIKQAFKDAGFEFESSDDE
jgi:hypothetical protein